MHLKHFSYVEMNKVLDWNKKKLWKFSFLFSVRLDSYCSFFWIHFLWICSSIFLRSNLFRTMLALLFTSEGNLYSMIVLSNEYYSCHCIAIAYVFLHLNKEKLKWKSTRICLIYVSIHLFKIQLMIFLITHLNRSNCKYNFDSNMIWNLLVLPDFNNLIDQKDLYNLKTRTNFGSLKNRPVNFDFLSHHKILALFLVHFAFNLFVILNQSNHLSLNDSPP